MKIDDVMYLFLRISIYPKGFSDMDGFKVNLQSEMITLSINLFLNKTDKSIITDKDLE